ncbi:MAG: tRNA (N(6)-L-threonylcarbamoyladenosine(37)-C(2))-methylthiotransferase MtaB, partial [Armatimonadia bacterium]
MSPNPPTAAIKTLGCKLNQFESQQIREQLARLGFSSVPFESMADVYIINSCTVTARTDRDCRRLIRHAHRLNPEAFIAVTGCYAQVHREELEAIPEADLVVGNDGKASLGHRIAERISPGLLGSQASAVTALPADHHSYADGEMLEGFAEHSRAFVKVQEGCDAHCAYCIIPQARGTSRSVPPEEVLAQAQRLIEAGFPELVM